MGIRNAGACRAPVSRTGRSTYRFGWRGQIALLLLAVGPVGAGVPWTSVVPWDATNVYVTAVRFDRAGNVVVAATLDEIEFSDIMVASFARADGTLRWMHRLPERSGTENFVYDTVVDECGDVVLSGFTDGHEEIEGIGTRFAAIKLDGHTGAVRWRSDLGLGVGRSVAIDGRGDVIVSGDSYRIADDGRFVDGRSLVRKLDGLDGRILWESADLGPGFWFPLALDGRGNVIVDGPAAIIKYAGANGREVWRSSAGETVEQVLSWAGGVVAHECHVNAESRAYETHVVRRRRNDGTERWRRVYPEGPQFGCLLRITTGRHGSVFVGGTDTSGVWIARLDGGTGVERWRTYFHRHRDAEVERIVIGGRKDVVVHWTNGVIAFSAGTGMEAWRLDEPTWRRHRVAVDGDGTVAFARDACLQGHGSGIVVSTLSGGLGASLPLCH